MKKVLTSFILALSSLVMLNAPLLVQSANLNQIQVESDKKIAEAQASQKKIDNIVAGAQERLTQHRALLKQIEGLKTYNEQLSTQVQSQNNLLQRFDESITQVALIERQMLPLVSKIVQSLEQFIDLDLPFYIAERKERLAYINENLVAADIDVAEKFRQVMEAYQIENEYGRKIDTYQAIVELNGKEVEVDVLRVGRVALVCQTKDTQMSAYWNNQNKTWEVLDNLTYRNSIRNGIKIAKKQASIDIVTLPISAPVADSSGK